MPSGRASSRRFPPNGATDVDPATNEIRVTFDKEMADECWSWVRSSPEAFPESTGDVHYLEDMKTCVMPVKLEPGTKYVVWFNTANYQNFKDREGRPAVPQSADLHDTQITRMQRRIRHHPILARNQVMSIRFTLTIGAMVRSANFGPAPNRANIPWPRFRRSS